MEESTSSSVAKKEDVPKQIKDVSSSSSNATEVRLVLLEGRLLLEGDLLLERAVLLEGDVLLEQKDISF